MHHRLLLTRLLLVALLPIFLFTHNIYPEGQAADTLLLTGGLILLLVSATGRIWASLYICGRKDQELVTMGPYSVVRHPLYLFSLIGFVGVGLAFGSIALAGLLGLVFGLFHAPTMKVEDQRLEDLFGEEFLAYKASVPAFLPRPCYVDSPGRLHVRTSGFVRSLREAALIPLILVAAEGLEWAKMAEVLPVWVLLP